mgnify:CR=1 FL=1
MYLHHAFFPFHITWRHSNKAVQEAVPLIITHPNDKEYLILKIFIRKGFKKMNK